MPPDDPKYPATRPTARCPKHSWKPLFAKPAPDDVLARFKHLKDHACYALCERCGAIGTTTRGYRKGGGQGHIVRLPDDRWTDEIRANADAWNAVHPGPPAKTQPAENAEKEALDLLERTLTK